MIVGVGVDIVSIDRVSGALKRIPEFAARTWTAGELEDCRDRADRAAALSARFAAKEACLKALGIGWSPSVSWQDVEIRKLPGGQPELRLTGGAAQRAGAMGATRWHVSLSHDGGIATAFVVLESAT